MISSAVTQACGTSRFLQTGTKQAEPLISSRHDLPNHYKNDLDFVWTSASCCCQVKALLLAQLSAFGCLERFQKHAGSHLPGPKGTSLSKVCGFPHISTYPTAPVFRAKPLWIIKYRWLQQTRAWHYYPTKFHSRKEYQTTERTQQFPSQWNKLPTPKLLCCCFTDVLQLYTSLSPWKGEPDLAGSAYQSFSIIFYPSSASPVNVNHPDW